MSLAKTLIKQALQEYKLNASKARRRQIMKYLDYYGGGNTEQYIDRYFNIDAFREVPMYSANITRKFIDKMSRVYTLGAERQVSEVYDTLTKHKDSRLKHVERMTNLVGSLATLVTYDEVRQMFNYKPIYYFDLFFEEMDAMKPEAVLYPLLTSYDDVSDVNELDFMYYDKEVVAQYDSDGNIVSEQENPYGVLPFLFTHKQTQLDNFFVEGACDIINCNEHVNITMTEMQLGLRFQMFGQPFATGVYEDTAITRGGSDTIINLPEGANFGIASPAGDLEKVIEVLKFQISLVAQNNHMQVYFEENADRPSSGLALIVKDYERMEQHKDDIESYREYEHELYMIERAIAEANGISLPEDFKVKFLQAEYPKSVQEQILRDNFDLEKGIISTEDIIMREDKDMTEAEAASRIAKNQVGVQNVSQVESQE
jgi:hypothetical protein